MKKSQQQPKHQGRIFGGFSTNERRKNPRYKMNKEILSISDEVLAEAVDISESGISCKCLAKDQKPLAEIHSIELLNCELGTSVKGFRCRLVRCNKRVSPASLSVMILNFSLEFQELNQAKRKQLFQFIKDGVMSTEERKNLERIL